MSNFCRGFYLRHFLTLKFKSSGTTKTRAKKYFFMIFYRRRLKPAAIGNIHNCDSLYKIVRFIRHLE